MIRLFTGLRLPADVADDVALLKGGLPGARWIEKADFHVTLQFIGNIEEAVADNLHDALMRIRKPPVEVILERLDVFGSRKPRAVVVAARLTPGLADLQAAHERICKQHHVEVESRKYAPHVTIARLRGIAPADVAQFADSREYFRPRAFVAESFFLFSSASSQGGGPYTAEAEYDLRA